MVSPFQFLSLLREAEDFLAMRVDPILERRKGSIFYPQLQQLLSTATAVCTHSILHFIITHTPLSTDSELLPKHSSVIYPNGTEALRCPFFSKWDVNHLLSHPNLEKSKPETEGHGPEMPPHPSQTWFPLVSPMPSSKSVAEPKSQGQFSRP